MDGTWLCERCYPVVHGAVPGLTGPDANNNVVYFPLTTKGSVGDRRAAPKVPNVPFKLFRNLNEVDPELSLIKRTSRRHPTTSNHVETKEDDGPRGTPRLAKNTGSFNDNFWKERVTNLIKRGTTWSDTTSSFSKGGIVHSISMSSLTCGKPSGTVQSTIGPKPT